MDILEKNKIIAEFMTSEPELLAKDLKKAGTLESMQYHSDWNWLMEVVEKIEGLNFTVNISASMVYINGDNGTIVKPINIWIEGGKAKMQVIFDVCFEFIKWYNENNK